MEILKAGRRTKDVTWCGKCSKCGAIMLATGDELTNIRDEGDYGNYSLLESFSLEDCPSCKNKKCVNFIESSSPTGRHLYAQGTYNPCKIKNT